MVSKLQVESEQNDGQQVVSPSQQATQSTRLQTEIQPCHTKTEYILHDEVIPIEEVEEKLMKA